MKTHHVLRVLLKGGRVRNRKIAKVVENQREEGEGGQKLCMHNIQRISMSNQMQSDSRTYTKDQRGRQGKEK